MNSRCCRLLTVVSTLAVLLRAVEANAAAALAVSGQSDLGFGQLVASASSGTVTVAWSGGRTSAGGSVLGSGMAVSAASFRVTGEPNTDYSITLPTACTLTRAGSSMTVDGFTSSPGGSGNLGPLGAQTVLLGATLHLSSSQPAGAYSGSYAVTVAYN
jgi:hypothetical protein